MKLRLLWLRLRGHEIVGPVSAITADRMIAEGWRHVGTPQIVMTAQSLRFLCWMQRPIGDSR